MAELRTYQRDLLQQVERALAAPDARVMLQLPTGGGKTRIAAALLAGWMRSGGKAAWLTHRRELSDQTCRVLNESGVLATNTLAWNVDDTAPVRNGGVVILMAQTVSRRNHYEGVWAEYSSKDLLVIDEAHHATADGWERAIQQWPGPAIGVTATPWRLAKNEGLKHLFECLILGPQIKEMQADGWLAYAQVLMPDADYLILGGEVTGTRDYNESGIELANQGRPGVMTAGALEFWQNRAQGRQTIVYAVSVRHAENLAAVFNKEGVRAAVILGNTPQEERRRSIRQFSEGELKVLVNVAVATEGFDLPDASCVVLTRPTMSLALYLQMVGRGLRRKSDGGNCLILDLAGNVTRHGFPDAERQWSLEPRGWQDEGQGPPVVRCPECDGVSPAASHSCQLCGNPFGKDCQRCGQWRAWKDWTAETYCGGEHDQVCNLCHPDAHALPNLPAGLKEMLRKEPVDSQEDLKLADPHTVDAARDSLCEVMENLIYANKVDDGGAFTRILEGQLRPLLRKEKRLRRDEAKLEERMAEAELERMTAEFATARGPSSLEFKRKIEELYEGRREVTAIFFDFEKGTLYQWEENGETHTSEWVQ